MNLNISPRASPLFSFDLALHNLGSFFEIIPPTNRKLPITDSTSKQRKALRSLVLSCLVFCFLFPSNSFLPTHPPLFLQIAIAIRQYIRLSPPLALYSSSQYSGTPFAGIFHYFPSHLKGGCCKHCSLQEKAKGKSFNEWITTVIIATPVAAIIGHTFI